ncbi:MULTISPECIES: chaperone NapD [Aliarcobacter]|jgi:nitrate reductase NapD|uniref:Chaperone NapD n=1 Tax=Aliarcobacter skirrowii CCUG 10374 TaxID=1032239 RepID=A0AAD0WMT5_9BACT|nr:chaperone NapD [Aliarcobacter skirrowii]AXX84177.1 periplasmic nitrate reductase assembly protein [Aliarcobacter skirrowii CCUG 10374]AZL53332.1 nitrate reductase [Aliarcobacter skirrowii]KAB0621639.1 nitrate reductase [Aliarcobacter skirrowii CCUG 10374]MDX4027178.1 chaperone NapD [Aliarcobacter skirrowii]MDX4039690.1 chaperone NapD [Aliarcobacter skirrowii]
MNISSIVVTTLPKNLESVIENLKKSGVCDYHMHDEKGRVIITIEGENVEDELKKLKVIEAIPNVITADMQMSYSEEELSRHMQVLENSDAVPKVLNNKDINVEDIVYRGDLKRKDLIGFAKEFDKKEL